MPRAYQRAAAADDSQYELAGETQDTILCYQATQPATQWTLQGFLAVKRKREDTEDEDDRLADFNIMEKEIDAEERLQQELADDEL
ncbi:hypothetical protein HRG_013359 [Hirsutella rhossiliensis]